MFFQCAIFFTLKKKGNKKIQRADQRGRISLPRILCTKKWVAIFKVIDIPKTIQRHPKTQILKSNLRLKIFYFILCWRTMDQNRPRVQPLRKGKIRHIFARRLKGSLTVNLRRFSCTFKCFDFKFQLVCYIRFSMASVRMSGLGKREKRGGASFNANNNNLFFFMERSRVFWVNQRAGLKDSDTTHRRPLTLCYASYLFTHSSK